MGEQRHVRILAGYADNVNVIRRTYVFWLDCVPWVRHNKGVPAPNAMKSAQLSPNLRYVSLSDDEGVFGLFVVHEGDRVRYTIEVTNYDEFRATVESFQEQPV